MATVRQLLNEKGHTRSAAAAVVLGVDTHRLSKLDGKAHKPAQTYPAELVAGNANPSLSRRRLRTRDNAARQALLANRSTMTRAFQMGNMCPTCRCQWSV